MINLEMNDKTDIQINRLFTNRGNGLAIITITEH